MRFQRIQTNFWFDTQAEEAVELYTSVFPNSKIVAKSHYTEEVSKVAGQRVGSVMTVEFELDGQAFTALNGGPLFRFNEAISLVVNCKDQAEVDHYWDALREGGDPKAQQCGWLKDRFGVSWQVVPVQMTELLLDPDKARMGRAMAAMLKMKKLDLAALLRAADGKA